MTVADRWREVHRRAVDVDPPSGHVVVAAPHPDDETLTIGGTIVRAIDIGASVTVVAVTDGGSAYPDRIEHDALAAIRRIEQDDALRLLGVHPSDVVALGVRDGMVAGSEDEVAHALKSICTPGTTLIAPWTSDVHTDHEAVGRAARRTADTVGCHLWFSLFWAWHEARPADLDGLEVVRVTLSDDERLRKRRALDCHVSQLPASGSDSILDTAFLEPSTWDAEYFVGSPRPGSR